MRNSTSRFTCFIFITYRLRITVPVFLKSTYNVIPFSEGCTKVEDFPLGTVLTLSICEASLYVAVRPPGLKLQGIL